MAVAGHGGLRLLEQRRDGPERLPRGEAPVTDPHQSGAHGVERDGQAQSAALP